MANFPFRLRLSGHENGDRHKTTGLFVGLRLIFMGYVQNFTNNIGILSVARNWPVMSGDSTAVTGCNWENSILILESVKISFQMSEIIIIPLLTRAEKMFDL